MAVSLLIELLTEELPPKSLRQLGAAFADNLVAEIVNHRLGDRDGSNRTFATPRRIAVLIEDVRERAPDSENVVEGPSASANSKAIEGFARKHNLAPDALERRQTPKGEIIVARVKTTGVKLDAVLANIVEKVLKKLPITRIMRWGTGDAQFVRPVHGLVMLHGSRVVPGKVLGLESGRHTRGHRFMGAAEITLGSADEYEKKLRDEGKVLADFDKRKSEIDAQLQAAAKQQNAGLGDHQILLDEVAALVEHPSVYLGEFNPAFLEVPQECLILSMKQHQKYFPLTGADGGLLPKFLVVSNLKADDPANIIHGNERVLRARLSDARFFYDQDRKTRLEARVPKLAHVVYHNKLGSQLERVERVQRLAENIARHTGADARLAERAAWLSKADLSTGMVGEFPELQGIMGRYYALHDGESDAVADALEAHYRPRYAGDRVPDGPVACAVALADKLESLAGMFGIGQQPSGDKDPFALRRHALGVIRILVEMSLAISIYDLVDAAFDAFPRGMLGDAHTDLRTFIHERLRGYLRDGGYTANEVEAVLCLGLPRQLDQLPRKLAAVRIFAGLPEAESLAAANKRVANILRQAEAKGESFERAEAGKLREPAERELYHAIEAAAKRAMPLFEQGDYTGYLKTFAILKSPVDAFFETVMVMVDDAELRKNRLALLAELRRAMNRVADISKLAA